MNKGSKVIYIGETNSDFTKGHVHKVLAGQGDGVPRNDGKLGAYIQNEHQFVVENWKKHFKLVSMKSGNWKIVEEAESAYVPKPEYKSPIQLTTNLC